MRFPRALLTVAAASFIVTPALASATTQANETVDTVAAASTGEPVAQAGKAIYSADGRRLGSIYKVMADGSAQLFLDSRLYTVPADTISSDDRKIVTSLSKKAIIDLRR